jgi:hypothetical protein
MDKEITIYLETERCKHLINSELDKVYNRCANKPTIKQGNALFLMTLNEAKRKAFNTIKSVVKPYVVYRINQYYHLYTA